jgi:hypothetical protein
VDTTVEAGAVLINFTVVEVMLRQLQAELMLLAGTEAGVRQLGGGEEAARLLRGPRETEVDTVVTVISTIAGVDESVSDKVVVWVVTVPEVVDVVEDTVGVTVFV